MWQRFQQHLCNIPSLGLTLDVSRMRFDDRFLDKMAEPIERAFEAMDSLERGAIANPDENRMVGHYWLRAPDLAPSPEIAKEIRKTVADVKAFAAGVHRRRHSATHFTAVYARPFHRHRRLGPGPDVRRRCARQADRRPHANRLYRQYRP